MTEQKSEKAITEKPFFSAKEVVYIMTIVAGYFIQQASFRQMMNDFAIQFGIEKTLKTEQVLQLRADLGATQRDVRFLMQNRMEAILPKETKIESKQYGTSNNN